MKKILVTGGAGFIGSNFIKICLEDEIEILNFDLLTYAGNLNNLKLSNECENYYFVKGDICDSDVFSKYLNEFNPDSIVHFAAESHVDRSIDKPDNFIKTNVNGTYTILNETLKYYKRNKNFKFIHVSTDEVFGSLDKSGSFDENSAYNPNSPYSASKASSDFLVRAWNKTYSFPGIITNCSNNYGPYQFPEKLIPLVIINCMDNQKIPIYGNGENIRDWIYVEDHCNALKFILENGKIGEKYNIGSNEERTNIEIVSLICEIMDLEFPSKKVGSYKELINFVEDRPSHDFRYAVNSTKIREELGWNEKYDLKTGLVKTVKWYLENIEWINDIRLNKYNLERLGKVK